MKSGNARSLYRFMLNMLNDVVYDIDRDRYVMNGGNSTKSLDREFYNTLCEVTEALSAKAGRPPACYNNLKEGGMVTEQTPLTLDEQGLDAVGDFLKGVAAGKPAAQSLEDRQLEIPWEEPIDNEVGL